MDRIFLRQIGTLNLSFCRYEASSHIPKPRRVGGPKAHRTQDNFLFYRKASRALKHVVHIYVYTRSPISRVGERAK